MGLLAAGGWEEDSWLRSGVETDFFLGKGLVERLCAGLGCDLNSHSRASLSFAPAGEPPCVITRVAWWDGWVRFIPMALQNYDLRHRCRGRARCGLAARSCAGDADLPRSAGISGGRAGSCHRRGIKRSAADVVNVLRRAVENCGRRACIRFV